MNRLRRLVQTLFAIVTNAYLLFPFGSAIYQGPLKSLCTPGLHCYSCPSAVLSCPVGAFQNMLGSLRLSLQSGVLHIGSLVVGYLGIIGVISGRFPCGWLCPFGLIQDLLYKIPAPKLKLPSFFNYFRYGVLIVLVVLLPLFWLDNLGMGQPWFCKLLCPSGTLTGALPLLVIKPALWQNIGFFFWHKIFWLVVILIGAVVISRFFCRILCPLGAFYGLFNRVSFFCLQYDEEKCVHCLACERRCPTGCKPYKDANSAACINCLRCIEACRFGALAFQQRPAAPTTLSDKVRS
ncbi:MAG: 4Fe-4S binding protein [Desulfobacca sp.]|uniref:4Fe-4S binding protein n=1 Tax=Desulfobacca sp. TaxID=2067990 RepID=UPI00404AF4EF